ncbi:hypothetical protein MJ561_09280 [Klebsiella pneumoniae]|nr:hypothetical protein MJ561_09280 [Klebsiella pneumoniae]
MSSAATGCLNPTSAVCWASCTNPPIRVAMAAFHRCMPPATIGSIIAPIACGYVQEEYSWAMGFATAAIGMVAGLVIFLCGNRHFQHTAGVNRQALCSAPLSCCRTGAGCWCCWLPPRC